ncbi:unnamed protein product [Pylaiella littoralis]
MSHTEAFGHLRSFVVGLEVKARDLRKVLESSRDEDGKWVNGKDGTGIGERCARAIGAATPEQVTKDMIAEVAEQDKLLRQVEEVMRIDKPVEEETEKYQALVEYNQLALEDLEDRLSAYGYVRPARVTLDTKAAVPSPVASSVARLPVRTETGTKSTAVQICDERDGTGDGGEGGGVDGRSVGSTGADATLGSDSSFSQQKQQEGSGGLGACSGAPSSACASGGIGTATSAGEGQDHLDEPSAVATRGRLGMGQEEACGDELGVSAVTPARPSVVVGEEPEEEEEPGSPPTPTSPGLADWEITEEARDMLRLAQPQQKSDNRNDNAAPPRSLEALLAVNTASSIGGRGSADASGLRSSVSSDWSPPSTRIALSRFSRSRQPSSDEGDVVVGTPGRDVCAAGTAGMQPSTAAAAAATGTGMEISATGSDADSNPPTPARMGFEGDEPPTPGGKNLAEAAPGSRDRGSSVGSPSLNFRSPLKSDGAAHLVETATCCGERLHISTPSEKGRYRSVMSPPQASPIQRASMEEEEDSLSDSLRKGPRGDFWSRISPASCVVAATGHATGEQPPPVSPETPPSPQMLSPRFRIESTGAGAASPSPGPATRSSSRKKASTPKVSLHNDDDNGSIDDSSRAVGSDHSNGNSDDNNGYDSDKCPTLELSSPLRSCAVSSRDLEVLTPSIAREKGDAGNDSAGGGYDRGSSCNDQGGGGSDGGDSDVCPTPELSSPLRSAGSAALCRRRLEEADGEGYDGGGDEKEAVAAELTACDGPLELVSEEEYARAPRFLTIQVSRSVLNDTIRNLNAYAAPRLASPSELLLTVNEIMDIIDQGELSRTLLLSAAHLKRVEMKGARMYRIRA